MALVEAFLQELDTESKTTRRVLERVPDQHLAWKPHAKSMSLGQLAQHLADSASYAAWVTTDVYDFSAGVPKQAQPTTVAEILDAFDENVANAKDILREVGDEGLMTMWKGVAGGATVMEMPKVGVIRVVLLNHTYHHRGQLSVYLRLLDVPVPSIYGPSADENRFVAEPTA